MRIERKFTEAGKSPYDAIPFRESASEIRNPDGSVVFSLEQFQVPTHWSGVAADILAQKYFRKAGVPRKAKRVEENTLPPGCGGRSPTRRRSPRCPRPSGSAARLMRVRCSTGLPEPGPIGAGRAGISPARRTRAPSMTTPLHACHADGRAQQPAMVQYRAALGLWHRWAEPGSLLCGPRHRRGKGVQSAYEHPQPHACFIQSIDDDLVNEGGIMDLWVREARLFKYGSGTGTNFSRLRGENEPLSGGGKSSGLMSFLKIGDRAAGAIKSGGTTRRAAKMVVVDIDHPDIEDYINWKVNEEHKVAALVTGSQDSGRAAQRHPQGLRQLRGRRRRLLRSQMQPGAEARGQSRAQGQGSGQRHPPGDPVRPPGLHLDPYPDLRHGLGLRGLSYRLGAELQQLGARHRRFPPRGRGGRRLEPHLPQDRQGRPRR